ncbi:hypothetical protein [Methyloglobulus sp.]|uniref:hypothetical protein n=1 Tax=Methyloglobulus sp. TaxID=2518622 RepID=UPI0032B831D8
MNPENIPVQSTKTLINASLVAVLLAVVILFIAVLPAEYGIDITGLGKQMGLTVLSDIAQKRTPSIAENCIKPVQTLTDNKAKSSAGNPNSDLQQLDDSKTIQWMDTVKIVIPPNKGLEYKFAMQKGAELKYSWSTDGASIYFDFHGEPKGAKNGYFKSYLDIMGSESKGALIAPFEGIHGWYWENETSQPITIHLSTNGEYEALGVMK